MIVERVGILAVSIILIIMLCIKYISRYNPINLYILPFISFVNGIYLYLIIYNITTHWYTNLILYFFNIIIPFILVFLQYNNIILKRQIIYYMMKYTFKIKEYDKTIRYINRLVNLEGRNNEYMYILGKCYKAKNDYINARDCFALAIELDKKDYLSYYEFGLILDETNKKEVACVMFNKALKINPKFYDAAEALGVSFTSQGNFKKAINVYTSMVKKFPNAYEIYYNIGMLEMELGNYAKAISAFDKCTSINTNLYMAYYNMGKLYFILGKYDDAILSYKKIVSSAVYGPKAYYKMAMIFAIKKEYEKAMANLEYAVELDESFLNDIHKESCFKDMKNIIDDFCAARRKLIKDKLERKNFMSEKFSFFKKSDNVKVKISV